MCLPSGYDMLDIVTPLVPPRQHQDSKNGTEGRNTWNFFSSVAKKTSLLALFNS